MNHQKTHQTNPMAQGNPLDAPLTPGTPIDPLRPLNRSLGLFECLKLSQLPYKSSENPSNVTVDPMGHLYPSP